MPHKIAILEHNPNRRQIMRSCLAGRFHMYEAHFFDEACALIEFLKSHLDECLVIALDHDLELKSDPDGRCIDCGTGRDVVDYLATRKPACPIIIHTSNSDAAVGMQMVLKDANWKTRRVVPFDDMNWIEKEWFPAIRRAIVGPTRHSSLRRSVP